MIFLELVLQNFGPYRGKHILKLDTGADDDSRSIVLFGGMNGGGKTTLMDAIRLALYGQRAQCSTRRNNISYTEFLVQCVSYGATPEDSTGVELTFQQLYNGVLSPIRVERYWTRQPKGGRDVLQVFVDDYPNDTLTKSWDERIEDILPLGISNLFLFDGEQVKELAEQEAPPQVVVDAVRSVLGLELVDRLSVDLEILASRKRRELAEAPVLRVLESIEVRLYQQQQEYEVKLNQLNTLQDQYQAAEEQLKLAEDSFVAKGGKIAGQREQFIQQVQQMKSEAESVRQKLRESAAGNLPLALIQPLLEEVYIQGQKELRRQQAEAARERLGETEQRLLEKLVQLNLKSKQVEAIKAFLEEENQTLEQEISFGESWLGPDSGTINQLAYLLSQQLPEQLELVTLKLTQLAELEEKIVSTEQHLAAAASPEAYEKLVSAVEQAKTCLGNYKFACEVSKGECDNLAQSIETTKSELSLYSEQAIDLTSIAHLLDSTSRVQIKLDSFSQKLTRRKLNQLETEVTNCFLYLLHKENLVNRVAIDEQTFRLSLFDVEGQPIPKHRLSAGEKQILAISFLWGLARVSGHCLPITIDTPLGRLDSSHRKNLIARYFPSASHQVILLSTDTEIGKAEVEMLRKHKTIAYEYLLEYDSKQRQTTVKSGYFW